MKGRSWSNPPPLFLLGGSEDFFLTRELQKASIACRSFGRRLVWALPEEVEDHLQESDTWGSSLLVVLEDPQGLSEEFFKELAGRKENNFSLLLLFRKEVGEKLPSPFTLVPGPYRLVFNQPSSRKDREKQAQKFLVEEARKDSLTLPESVAEALITLVGDDLGTLYHEYLKASLLARARKVKDLDANLFREVLRPSSDTDLRPTIASLANRDGLALLKALHRLRAQSENTGDPVMLLLRSRGGPVDQILLWYQVSLLLEKGASAEEIASRTGAPKWAIERDAIPAAKKWGPENLSSLIADLSSVEGALLRGAPSPWNSLVSVLVSACPPLAR